jgi:hypothetical protein
MLQGIPNHFKGSDFLFNNVELFQSKVMCDLAYVGAVQLQQPGNIVQIESKGLRPLDEPDPLHIGLAVHPMTRSRPHRLGQQLATLIKPHRLYAHSGCFR